VLDAGKISNNVAASTGGNDPGHREASMIAAQLPIVRMHRVIDIFNGAGAVDRVDFDIR
jgi:hypothetical protein